MPAKADQKTLSVLDVQHLTQQIYRVTLSCIDEYLPDYFAGQYLKIHLPKGDNCAFSIASPPEKKQTKLELHIQKIPDRKSSQHLFKQFVQGFIEVSLPFGRCHLQSLPKSPLLFVAAGTGFAQIKSMIEYAKKMNHPQDIYFYWGARSPADYYLPNLPVQWLTQGVHYHPVVSEASSNENWNGRHGLLYEALTADKQQLSNCEIYLSGSPTMVYATVDALSENGFSSKKIHSDVFEYAPRD